MRKTRKTRTAPSPVAQPANDRLTRFLARGGHFETIHSSETGAVTEVIAHWEGKSKRYMLPEPSKTFAAGAHPDAVPEV